MGKPLAKNLYANTIPGTYTLRLSQAWIPGMSAGQFASQAANAVKIIKQLGTRRYMAKDVATGITGVVTLQQTAVNAPGEAIMFATPFGSTSAGSGAAATARLTAKEFTIGAAGQGYNVDDVLTISGGTGTAAKFKVKTVDENGAIQSIEIANGGSYSVAVVAGNRATTVAPAGGTGATVAITDYTMVANLTAGGTLYNEAPLVAVSAGNATVVAQITGGVVVGLVVDGGVYLPAAAAPSLTFTATAKEHVRTVFTHSVLTFERNRYTWYAKPSSASKVGEADLPLA
jgi:hypothetical protein